MAWYDDLLWWDPWAQLRSLERRADRLRGQSWWSRQLFPPVSVWAARDSAVVTAEIPGVPADTLDISIEGDVLTIKGERKAPELKEGEGYHRRERQYGLFARAVKLPFAVEPGKVEATCKDGVLRVVTPRADADKPRQITVTTA